MRGQTIKLSLAPFPSISLTESFSVLNQTGEKFGAHLRGHEFFLKGSCCWERYDCLEDPATSPDVLEREFEEVDREMG